MRALVQVTSSFFENQNSCLDWPLLLNTNEAEIVDNMEPVGWTRLGSILDKDSEGRKRKTTKVFYTSLTDLEGGRINTIQLKLNGASI